MLKNIFENNKIAFGLDINDRSLKIAKVKSNNGLLSLVSAARVEIPEGYIERGDIKKSGELSRLIKDSLKKVLGESLGTKRCVCSLPEKETFIKVIQMPKMEEIELKEAIRWEVEANIPLKPEQAYVDWQIIEPLKNHIDHVDVLIAALPREFADPYLVVLKDAGIKPVAFEVESVAIARALIKNCIALKPQLILDLGSRHSVATIFSGSSIFFTASLSYSSTSLVEAIAGDLKIDLLQAKKLKESIGLGKSDQDQSVGKILIPYVSELSAQLKKFIQFYEDRPRHDHPLTEPIEKIILCGGGANLAGLVEILFESLKVPVQVGDPMVNLSVANSIEIPGDEVVTYATALGLAIRGAQNL